MPVVRHGDFTSRWISLRGTRLPKPILVFPRRTILDECVALYAPVENRSLLRSRVPDTNSGSMSTLAMTCSLGTDKTLPGRESAKPRRPHSSIGSRAHHNAHGRAAASRLLYAKLLTSLRRDRFLPVRFPNLADFGQASQNVYSGVTCGNGVPS